MLLKNSPNFFIIGAAKAGTTSLYDMLNQHPQVYFPFVKEPAYFCDDEYYAKGNDWYLNNFFRQVEKQPARGEATSRYLFFGNKVAPRIYTFPQVQTPKFISIFRDPAKLVYSFYWNSIREGHETLAFSDALQAEAGRMLSMQNQLENRGQILFAYSRIAQYARQISHFLEIFPRENFLFLLTEDLPNNPTLISSLQSFLGLDDYSKSIQPVNSNQVALPKNRNLHSWLRNRSWIKEIIKPLIPFSIRYKLKTSALEHNLQNFTPPEMDPEIANSLRVHYSEDTRRLQDIIQRDLSKWLPL